MTMGTTWFENLTGFSETSPRQVRSKIELDGPRMTSSVNGRTMTWGRLETPSLGDLRERTHGLGHAEVLEKLGRPEEAIQAYERVLELWKDADPALQPMVEEARQRRNRLAEKTADPSSRTESNAQGL